MARNIYIVNATQVVTSESHPEGLFSTTTGFPKVFDSANYASMEAASNAARSAYYDQLSKNYANTNPNRVMTTVTLEMANGVSVMHECIGNIPEVPEPEAEEEPQE